MPLSQKPMEDWRRRSLIVETKIVDQSKTTFENLKFSKMMTEDMEGKRVGIATSNFHIYRSVKLAKHLGYKKVFPMPAGCNFIYFLNYMVREFFAVLLMVYRLKKNRA